MDAILQQILEKLQQIERRLDERDHSTLLTAQQAADKIGVSRVQLIRYINEGKLAALQADKYAEYRIRLSDLNEFSGRTRAPKNGYMHKAA